MISFFDTIKPWCLTSFSVHLMVEIFDFIEVVILTIKVFTNFNMNQTVVS